MTLQNQVIICSHHIKGSFAARATIFAESHQNSRLLREALYLS